MRTTLLGSLLTSVRHNVARGREDVRLFEEGSVYFDRPHGRELTAAEARSTPLPDERMHLGALVTGRLRPAVVGRARRRRAPTSSPPRACWRRCWARCACDWSVVRGDDPFLHPGRAARVLVAGEDAAGSARSTRASLPSGTWAGSRASSSTSARSSRTPTTSPPTRT